MITLDALKPPQGARKKRKRIGRGEGSGHGGTSTRGHKGIKARSGGKARAGYEGGQMPMQRRLPKRGFKNPFREEFEILNLKDLSPISSGGGGGCGCSEGCRTRPRRREESESAGGRDPLPGD